MNRRTSLPGPESCRPRGTAQVRYLEAQHSWLFTKTRGRIETNSLQLVKQPARSGHYVGITSELDAEPELIDGTMRFPPVRDKSAEPQTISISVDASNPLEPVDQEAT